MKHIEDCTKDNKVVVATEALSIMLGFWIVHGYLRLIVNQHIECIRI